MLAPELLKNSESFSPRAHPISTSEEEPNLDGKPSTEEDEGEITFKVSVWHVMQVRAVIGRSTVTCVCQDAMMSS